MLISLTIERSLSSSLSFLKFSKVSVFIISVHRIVVHIHILTSFADIIFTDRKPGKVLIQHSHQSNFVHLSSTGVNRCVTIDVFYIPQNIIFKRIHASCCWSHMVELGHLSSRSISDWRMSLLARPTGSCDDRDARQQWWQTTVSDEIEYYHKFPA